MTDEDETACAASWEMYAGDRAWDAHDAGFRAGLAHARTWRPLTDDPKSWPEEGQTVALICRRNGRTQGGSLVDFDKRAVGYYTHYLPLPDPPQKGGG